jgi:hypothetical protein
MAAAVSATIQQQCWCDKPRAYCCRRVLLGHTLMHLPERHFATKARATTGRMGLLQCSNMAEWLCALWSILVLCWLGGQSWCQHQHTSVSCTPTSADSVNLSTASATRSTTEGINSASARRARRNNTCQQQQRQGRGKVAPVAVASQLRPALTEHNHFVLAWGSHSYNTSRDTRPATTWRTAGECWWWRWVGAWGRGWEEGGVGARGWGVGGVRVRAGGPRQACL